MFRCGMIAYPAPADNSAARRLDIYAAAIATVSIFVAPLPI